MISDSDSSENDEVDDVSQSWQTQGAAGVEGEAKVTEGASSFYPGFKDISAETDVRFHISKRECTAFDMVFGAWLSKGNVCLNVS